MSNIRQKIGNFIKLNYFFFIGIVFNICFMLIFIIWSIFDAINWNDWYVSWVLVLMLCVTLINSSNVIILRKMSSSKSKKLFVIGIINCILTFLLIFGIVSSVLTLIQYGRIKNNLTKTNLLAYYTSPPLVCILLLSPLIAFSVPQHIDPWNTNHASVGDIKPDSWMSSIPDLLPDGSSVYLSDLSLPASHDALSRYTNEWSLGNTIKEGNLNHGWAQTQGYSFEEQLNRGIRIFDLRFAYVYDKPDTPDDPGTYYAVHSYSWLLDKDGKRIKCEDIYRQACIWLNLPEHSAEVLILNGSITNLRGLLPPPNNVSTIANYVLNKNESIGVGNRHVSDFAYTSLPPPTLLQSRGKFSFGKFNFQPYEDTENFFDDHDWNTQMWNVDSKWKSIKQNILQADQMDFGWQYYGNSMNMTGWDINNLRNNPMKAARILNNRLIGLLSYKNIVINHDLTKTHYSGWWSLDTAPGDLEENHSAAAAIYMQNFIEDN